MTVEVDEETARRKQLLELAEELGSVTAACRRLNVSRTLYYRWKQRYDQAGEAGLSDRVPGPSPGTRKIDLEVITAVLDVCRREPHLSCYGIVRKLQDAEMTVSHTTVQQILSEVGLGQEIERVSAANGQIARPLNDKRLTTLPNQPGQILCQWTRQVQHFPGKGNLKVVFVVDLATRGVFERAFFEGTSDTGNPAVALLRDEVLPYFRAQGHRIETIWTPRGEKYTRAGRGTRAEYCDYLRSLGIRQEALDSRSFFSIPGVREIRLPTLESSVHDGRWWRDDDQ